MPETLKRYGLDYAEPNVSILARVRAASGAALIASNAANA